MKKVPQIHGSRPEDYYYVISGKKGTKIYYSKILGVKIAKSEIDTSFINDIKEQLPRENYRIIVDLIDKRTRLEEKRAIINNQIAAVNDQLHNMGINTPTQESEAVINLTTSMKEDAIRRDQFNIERDAILRGTFMQNGWEYHGYKTGANLHPKKPAAPTYSASEHPKTDYTPKPGNFNYHDDDSSESDYIPKGRSSTESPPVSDFLKPNSCDSKFTYSSTVLLNKRITTKKEWLKWLKANHVDKGGNEAICSEVITAGRAKGW